MNDTYDVTALAQSGQNVWIDARVSIRHPKLVLLGNHIAIDPYLHLTTGLRTGDYIHISSHVSVIGGEHSSLIMGSFTNIGTGGRIVCGSDQFKGEGLIAAPGIPARYRDQLIMESVVFEDFANLGASVTILPGVRLPEGVVIGAASLVRKNDLLEPWTIYAGNPLRMIQRREKEAMQAYSKAIYDLS